MLRVKPPAPSGMILLRKEQYSTNLCRGPFRPELRLDELHLMGYLAADVFGRELINELEAQSIGKNVLNRWQADKLVTQTSAYLEGYYKSTNK